MIHVYIIYTLLYVHVLFSETLCICTHIISTHVKLPIAAFTLYLYMYTATLLSISASIESGMSFKITAAIQKKSTTGNEDTTPYELLQLPHSTENSQWTSETTSRPDSSHHPPLPLQLGRLTSELYRLHSSSTHSLNTVTSFQDRRGSVDSTTAKSLQNLDKFADEDSTSLDAYTQPSISVTNRGKGSFQELFLPPPIIPLPKTKKKATLRSSSRNMTANHSGRVTPNCKKGSRTPTPEQQHSNKPQSNMQSNYEDPNLASTPSLSHVAEKGHMTSGSRSSMAMEGSTETSCHSNVVQKLLQKRAKFCTPGIYNMLLDENSHSYPTPLYNTDVSVICYTVYTCIIF